jgi:hypothetical protein
MKFSTGGAKSPAPTEAKPAGSGSMKFSTGGTKSPAPTEAKPAGSGSMKFSTGGAKSPAPAEAKPAGSGSMKFSTGGTKSPAPTEAKPAGSGSMKFSTGGAKSPAPTVAKPAGSGSMKFTTGGAKNAHQAKPVYTLPSDYKATPGKASTLSKVNSDSVLRQVNSARATLRGVNARPVPQGQVSVHKDGGLSVAASGGRTYTMRADGSLASFSGHGRNASFNPGGRIRALHTDKIDISHGLRGERRIQTVRPDKSVLVTTGRNRGYLQRPVSRHSRTFIQRTYVEGNITSTREYSTYSYNGMVLESYAPRAHYAPALYDWAGNPWPAPVSYQWGWSRDPWYGANNGFFTALTAYRDATQLLTDYILAQTMKTAYQDPVEGNEPPQASYAETDTPISPETREAIAQEVRFQLEQEKEAALNANQAAGYGELPAVLNDPQHLFVVSSSLVVTTNGQGCGLTPGDILQLTGAPPEGVQIATLSVVSSKRLDCPANSVVTVSLSDLQAMQNNMREQIDSGLGTLRTGQGAKGIPSAPRDAIAVPRPTDVADLSLSEANVQAMLQAQQKEADQAEAEVMQAAFAEDAKKI